MKRDVAAVTERTLRTGIVLSDGAHDIMTLSPDGTLTADWQAIARLKDEWKAGTGTSEKHRWAALIWHARNA